MYALIFSMNFLNNYKDKEILMQPQKFFHEYSQGDLSMKVLSLKYIRSYIYIIYFNYLVVLRKLCI